MKANSILSSLPTPNVKISFGEGSNMHIQFYSESIPNLFQRWMIKKSAKDLGRTSNAE